MSRNKYYQKLLNSQRWKELRRAKLQRNPLCERCQYEGRVLGIIGGYIRSAVDVHHVIPVESARSHEEMERLAFDMGNLQSLCVPCHIRVHQDRGSHTKAAHQQRAEEWMQQWISRHEKRGTAADGETPAP